MGVHSPDVNVCLVVDDALDLLDVNVTEEVGLYLNSAHFVPHTAEG